MGDGAGAHPWDADAPFKIHYSYISYLHYSYTIHNIQAPAHHWAPTPGRNPVSALRVAFNWTNVLCIFVFAFVFGVGNLFFYELSSRTRLGVLISARSLLPNDGHHAVPVEPIQPRRVRVSDRCAC